jgi:hypothetical protein
LREFPGCSIEWVGYRQKPKRQAVLKTSSECRKIMVSGGHIAERELFTERKHWRCAEDSL